MNWQGLDQWQQWTLGIGGSLAAAIIIWVSQRVFSKRIRNQNKGVRVVQNASPVLTQNFQPTINIHPPGATAPTIPHDVVFHVSSGGSDETTAVVRELWKHFVDLKTAFWTLPKLGGVFGPNDPASRYQASAGFVDQYNKTVSFLHAEIIIPRMIAEEAKAVLKIAEDEAMRARHCPDPFDGNVAATYGEPALRDLLEQRSTELVAFTNGTESLHNTIRAFLEGKSGAGPGIRSDSLRIAPASSSFVLEVPRVPFLGGQKADFRLKDLSSKNIGFGLRVGLPRDPYWRVGFILAPVDYVREGTFDIEIKQYFLFHLGKGEGYSPWQSSAVHYQAYYNGAPLLTRTPWDIAPTDVVKLDVELRGERGFRVSATSEGASLNWSSPIDPNYMRYLYVLAWADGLAPFRIPVTLDVRAAPS